MNVLSVSGVCFECHTWYTIEIFWFLSQWFLYIILVFCKGPYDILTTYRLLLPCLHCIFSLAPLNTLEPFLSLCDGLGRNEFEADYSWFYSALVTKQIMAGKGMIKKLMKRKQIREEVTWRKNWPTLVLGVWKNYLLNQPPECSDILNSCSSS